MQDRKKSELTTLCYIEKDGSYLMLHRVKKDKDVNKDKNFFNEEWVSESRIHEKEEHLCRNRGTLFLAAKKYTTGGQIN